MGAFCGPQENPFEQVKLEKLSKPLEILGAPASNAGDEFHEAWALGKALMLLDPATNLKELTVEGVRDAPETDVYANWDGVDCALYFQDPNVPQEIRVELVQLKYSVTGQKKSWTLVRFCSSTKKTGNNSVARRLADAFKGAAKERKLTAEKQTVSVKLVTNQPIASDLEKAIAKAARNELNGTEYDTLKRATGLGKKQLIDFCHALSLEGGAVARAELREQNSKEIAKLLLSPVKDMADNLRVRVQELLGPEGNRSVTRDTLLSWFNLGRGQGLFPCETEFEPLAQTIARPSAEALATAVERHPLVVMHGKGGCGKTTMVRSLEAALPDSSKTIVYDCYGAGSYRDPSRPRHSSWQGFTQLANELARATNTPLFFPYHERDDMAPAFRQKLENAAEIFGREYPEGLLVLVVDAADNIVTHAAKQTPPQKCFVHQLAGFTDLPKNVRIAITCRTSRLHEMSLPEGLQQVFCPEFSLEETKAFVGLNGFNGSDVEIHDFHTLSRNIPRVQSSALAGASALSEAVNFLKPNGRSLNDLFEAKVRTAFDRSGVTILRSTWCSALNELASPIPIDVLARACQISVGDAEDIIVDLAPSLRIGDRGVEFSNEDFEEYCEKTGQSKAEETCVAIADVLISDRLSSSYAASHLFDALIASGRKSEMGQFLAEKNGTEAISDPVVRKRVDLSRLQAALHIASNDQDEIAVGETIFVGAEAMRTSGKVDHLILNNSDLSAAFLEQTIGALVLNNPDERSKQGSVLFALAREKARQGKSFESRLNLQTAEEWMRETFKDKTRHRNWDTQSEDVVTRLVAFFALGGWSVVENDCERWTNPSYRIALRKWVLARLVVEFGPDVISDVLKGLDPRFHFLAINCMHRASTPPTSQQSEEALEGLESLDFADFGKDEGFGAGPSTTAELQSEVLFFLEGLVRTGKITQSNSKSLLKRLGDGQKQQLRKMHLTYPYPVDFAFRTSILFALSREEKPNLASVFVEPKRPEGEERTEEAQREYQLSKERYDEIRGLIPAYQAYADLLCDRTETSVRELDQTTSRLGSTSSRSYQFAYVRSLLRIAATDLLASSDLGKGNKFTFVRAALLESEGFDDLDRQLCQIVLHNPTMHDAVAEALDAKSDRIRGLQIRATEKSEYLLSIARVFLGFSEDLASTAFADALKIAEDVDLEALDVLHALCRIVKRTRQDTPDARDLVGSFAGVVRHAGDLLQSEDGFPLDEALEAITVSNPPVGSMTASRWGDEGFSTRGNELGLFLKSSLDIDWLDPFESYALAQVLGDLPQSVEDKILEKLDEEKGDASDALLTHLIKRKILETTPYSDAYIPNNLEQLCKSGRKANELWLQLQEVRTFKAQVPRTLKDKNKKENVEGVVPDEETEELPVDWSSIDPLSPTAISKAQEDGRASGLFDYKDRLLELRQRVNYSDRRKHLDALAHCARGSRWPDTEIQAIFAALENWTDSVTTEWCNKEIPRLTVGLGGKTMGYNWYHGELFTELQDRSGLSPEGRRQVVLDLVEKNAEQLGAASLLKLLAEYTNNLDPATADALLARLLKRTEARLGMDDQVLARYTFAPEKLPTSPKEVLSALIYRYLGDIDIRVRWKASHALLCAVQLGLSDTIKEVFRHAIGQFDCHYTFSDCPFQIMNADQNLSILLARVSTDYPTVIAGHEDQILQIWTKNQPHILIGHFLARALEQARRAGAKVVADEKLIGSMNGSRATRATRSKDRYSRDFQSHSDPGLRFSFDSMDIIPYWYSPACCVFVDLPSNELIRVAEEWIVDRWGGNEETGHWANEPRRGRLRDDEFGLYSAGHGSRPTLHRHSVYLQWHGLQMAVGELIKTHHLVTDDGDHYDTFEGWLERDDTTYPTLWLSDLLGPLPQLNSYWQVPEPDRDDWVSEVEAIDPIGELIGEDQVFVLNQYREHRIYGFGSQAASSEIRSNAAFVPTKTAPALLRAYEATTDYYDVFIPDRDDFDDDGSQDSDFSIIPTHQRPTGNRDTGTDEEDPRCFKGRSIQSAPSKQIFDALKLASGPLWAVSWSEGQSESADLIYRAWSTAPDDSDRSMRHRSYSFIDGYRLSITKTALQNSMNALSCDLIVTVNLERSIGDDYGQSRKKRTSKRRVDVIRFSHDGTYETRSGDRGTWTQTHS